MKKLEACLRLIADLNRFTGESEGQVNCELTQDELELAAAAAARPDYRKFREILRKRGFHSGNPGADG